jgi:hypothetical protein
LLVGLGLLPPLTPTFHVIYNLLPPPHTHSHSHFLQDKRQFGPAPNKLMADVANMETSMNIERGGSGKDNSGWKRLSQAKRLVEMNLRYVRYWC